MYILKVKAPFMILFFFFFFFSNIKKLAPNLLPKKSMHHFLGKKNVEIYEYVLIETSLTKTK